MASVKYENDFGGPSRLLAMIWVISTAITSSVRQGSSSHRAASAMWAAVPMRVPPWPVKPEIGSTWQASRMRSRKVEISPRALPPPPSSLTGSGSGSGSGCLSCALALLGSDLFVFNALAAAPFFPASILFECATDFCRWTLSKRALQILPRPTVKNSAKMPRTASCSASVAARILRMIHGSSFGSLHAGERQHSLSRRLYAPSSSIDRWAVAAS